MEVWNFFFVHARFLEACSKDLCNFFFFVGDINDLNDEVSQSSKKMTSTLTPSSSIGADPQSPLSSVDNVFPTSQSTGAIGEEPGSGDCMYQYHIVHFYFYTVTVMSS